MEQLTYSFIPSHQLKTPLEIKIESLDLASRPSPKSSDIFRDPRIAFTGANTKHAFEFYLTIDLWANNKNFWPSMQTKYRTNKTDKVIWKEHIKFCDICDLPQSTQFAITIWDIESPGKKYAFASTTVSVFDDNGLLKRDRQKLLLHMGREADPRMETGTPSATKELTEVDRLEMLVKEHEIGSMPREDWLDNLAFRQIEKIVSQAPRSEHNYLIIDFPRFDFPVLYTEGEYSYSIKPEIPLQVNSLVMVYDPEAQNSNPVEAKHRRLVRSHRNGPLDRDLKPNPRIRDTLRDIVNQPVSAELTSEEKDLLWRFRYHLSRQSNTLPKFMRSVVWSDNVERTQAVALLSRWNTITIDSALELLGPDFGNIQVRRFAVERLEKANDLEITLYLLQLVQALRYEPEDSPLQTCLINRSRQNDRIAGQLFWYLTVESSDQRPAKVFSRARTSLLEVLPASSRTLLERQEKWVNSLVAIAEDIKQSKENRLKKIEKLQTWAQDRRSMKEHIPFPLDPTLQVSGFLPERCSVFKSSLFPLRLSLLTHEAQRTSRSIQKDDLDTDDVQRESAISGIEPGRFEVIFKSGDDLRQDQLVIQIITLFNDLLLRENLDLKLTPYRILATGPTSGFVEFVESSPLATILSEFGTLANYLGGTTTRKVDEEIMDTYVRSCAGYCVITYLMGVGDRHLDNLLLTKDGRFFHADFGFILGRDPKPFAPALKLVREMVDVMNINSPSHDTGFWYSKFKSYSFTAFSALRKNSAIVLNLFNLMVDANIPDIRIEPTRAVGKIMERFCLEMDEEQSLRFFEDLLIESVSALFPVLIDRVHNIAQYLRA